MGDRRDETVPPLQPGDLYVYVFRSGAVHTRLVSDEHPDLVDLVLMDDVLVNAADTVADGGRVLVASDGSGPARKDLARLRDSGIAVVEARPVRRPVAWPPGSTALIHAASGGHHRLVAELLDRGTWVDERDDHGAAAIDHARVAGHQRVVELLERHGAVHGADPVRRSSEPATPDASRPPAPPPQMAPSPAAPAGTPVRFRWQLGGPQVYLFPPLVVLVTVALTWPLPPAGWVMIAIITVATALTWPPSAFWLGGSPHRLDGETLVVRRWTFATREIDLRQVTLLAIGGAPTRHRGRNLVLRHPDGAPLTRRGAARLALPETDFAQVIDPHHRYVVVPVGAGTHHHVIAAIGEVLARHGVPMTGAAVDAYQSARRHQAARTDRR